MIKVAETTGLGKELTEGLKFLAARANKMMLGNSKI